MSCPNATAPIDIVRSIADECDLKCDYSFKYPMTSVTADNKGDFIRLSFDPEKEPSVRFNNAKYNCQEARIYQPSLHTFAGKHSIGEMVIVHQSDTTAQTLLVCVPIVEDPASKGSTIDALMTQIAAGAPRAGSRTGISMDNFSLDRAVPNKPYYSYTGTLPYSPCNNKVDYVVFDSNFGMKLGASGMASLATPGHSIITSQSYAVHTNPDGYYINNRGPSPMTATGDDIYIECHPTGADGKVLVPEGGAASGSGKNLNMGETVANILKSPWISALFGVFILLLVFKIFDLIASKVFGSNQSGGTVQSGGNALSTVLSAISKPSQASS